MAYNGNGGAGFQQPPWPLLLSSLNHTRATTTVTKPRHHRRQSPPQVAANVSIIPCRCTSYCRGQPSTASSFYGTIEISFCIKDSLTILTKLKWKLTTTSTTFGQQEPKEFQYVPSSSDMTLAIQWQALLFGWLKLKTDGASRGNRGNLSCDGVIRDNSRKWLVGYVSCLGQNCTLMAELQCILCGLQIARDREYSHIIVESDSTLAIALINNPPPSHPLFTKILCRIHHLINLQWSIHLVHTYREANKVADS